MTLQSAPDPHAMPVNWAAWQRAFSVSPADLWGAPGCYPQLAAGIAAPPLTADMLLSLAAPAFDGPRAAFEAYLHGGELAAADLLIPLAAPTAREQEYLRRKLEDRRAALDQRYNQARDAADAAHRRLVELRLRPQHDSVFDAITAEAEEQRRGRTGAATALLDRTARAMLDEGVVAHEKVKEDIESARADPRLVASPLRNAQLAHLALGERYWDAGYDDLARSATIAVMHSHETGTLPAPSAEAVGSHLLREDFPDDVRARHIVAWVEEGQLPAQLPRTDWRAFVRKWLPPEWQEGGMRSNDLAFTAIRKLADSIRTTVNSKGSTWPTFLKDFFDLLGWNKLEPPSFEELNARTIRRVHVGFWLGRCSPTLALRGSFIDPDRLPNGLPLIIWHHPRESSVRPNFIDGQLRTRGLKSLPFLVFANERVERESVRAFHDIAPGAAVLDETALLRIILSPTDGDAVEETRRLHLAAAASSQIPEALASPYTESGAASRVMFFGRGAVLSQLQDPNGPTILYGGRRLGKSSILRELERAFVAEEPALHIAIYVDCSGAGMTAESVRHLVRRIADSLRDYVPANGIIYATPPYRAAIAQTEDAATFINAIRAFLGRYADVRLLLLLDEADMLCGYLTGPDTPERTDEQRLGWMLRGLVAEMNRRFDIRFAGFQEIHRSTTDASGPFYNFRAGRTSLALKVFEPEEATELLVSTLRGLAVEFEDRALVEQVLELSGRHPAILQECARRLYVRARSRGRGPWRIVSDDVSALNRDSELRKSIVNTIHLNVSRATRAQRTLALLLYLWVQQLMGPRGGTRPGETRTARDLHDLVGDVLGTEAQLALDVSAIEAYLNDLVVLGVLDRRDNRYAFAYRTFATLLYQDYFSGSLSHKTIQDQWDLLKQDAVTSPRTLVRNEHGYTLSPLTFEDQSRLPDALDRAPILILGPAGTGRSLVAQRVVAVESGTGDAAPRVMPVVPAAPDAASLRAALAAALDLPPCGSWAAFADAARAVERRADRPRLLCVLDGVDALAESEDLPLIIDESGCPYEHVFALLADFVRESHSACRFLFTGGLPMARLRVAFPSEFAVTPSVFRVARLAHAELPTWLTASRVVGDTEATRTRIWDATGGDWRLLIAFMGWLSADQPAHADGEVNVDLDRVDEFIRITRDPQRRAESLPMLHAHVMNPALEGLRTLVRIAHVLDVEEEMLSSWAAQCAEAASPNSSVDVWLRGDWERELRALASLGEIREEVSVSATPGDSVVRLVVPTNDPWLTLLRT